MISSYLCLKDVINLLVSTLVGGGGVGGWNLVSTSGKGQEIASTTVSSAPEFSKLATKS